MLVQRVVSMMCMLQSMLSRMLSKQALCLQDGVTGQLSSEFREEIKQAKVHLLGLMGSMVHL
jgi:hypothetical protein